MNEREISLIIHAIDVGLRADDADSEHEEVANTFRILRTVLFDCFKSEYKPGVTILLEYLKLSGNSSTQLVVAIGALSGHRKAEIIKCARRILSLETIRNSISRK